MEVELETKKKTLRVEELDEGGEDLSGSSGSSATVWLSGTEVASFSSAITVTSQISAGERTRGDETRRDETCLKQKEWSSSDGKVKCGFGLSNLNSQVCKNLGSKQKKKILN